MYEDWHEDPPEPPAPPVQQVQSVHKTGSTWPDRPTTDPTVLVLWIGPDPSPPGATAPAVNGMYPGDLRITELSADEGTTAAVTSVDNRIGAVTLSDRYVALASGRAAAAQMPTDYTTFGRNRGSGTSLPATDLRRGDLYFHTDRGLFVYTGVAWRQDRPHELTKAQRTALDTIGLHGGYQVYETDTDRTWQWSGAKWRWVGGGATPHIKVRRTATWTTGTSGWQGVPWQQRMFTGTASDDTTDTSMWVVGTPTRLFAPIDGLYLAEASIGFPLNATPYMGFLRNGEPIASILRKASVPASTTSGPELNVTEPVRLAAGQYIETVIYSAAAIILGQYPTEQQPSMSLTWIGNY